MRTKDKQVILNRINHDKEKTQIGWTGFILGLIFGMLIATLLASANSPSCYEDEVIVWTGEAHDHCVPIDKFHER